MSCSVSTFDPLAVQPPADAAEQPGAAGGTRAAVEALIAAIGDDGVLGIVVGTSGSTYAKPGTLICISPSRGRVGWISGGCLEASLEEEAYVLNGSGQAGLVEFDTRDDADLMFGTRTGCRGLVNLALIPLRLLSGIDEALRVWTRGATTVNFRFLPSGRMHVTAGELRMRWDLPWRRAPQTPPLDLSLPAAPRVLLFGAGPEAAVLVPWMRHLGWYVHLVERRTRWTSQLNLADLGQKLTPGPAVAELSPLNHDAAVIMNHDFELDREALEVLADTTVPWIGLLGPARRRDDLLRLLGDPPATALRPRLHAPVGLSLGGRGPEAIALAIAAQLHADHSRV